MNEFPNEAEFNMYITELDSFSPESIDGASLKTSSSESLKYYAILFRDSKEMSAILSEYKRIVDIPFDTENLYCKERDWLKVVVPKLFGVLQSMLGHNASAGRLAEMYAGSIDACDVAEMLLSFMVNPIAESRNYASWDGYDPVFTHYPYYRDIAAAHGKDPVYMALANAARLYSARTAEGIYHLDDANCTVRLWRRASDGFEPFSVTVNKEELLRTELAANDNKALWPVLYADAIKKSGIDVSSPGLVTETLFGEDFEFFDCSDDILDARYDERRRPELYKNIDEWLMNGFPVSIRVCGGGQVSPGWYNVWSMFTDGSAAGEYYLRISSIKETIDVNLNDLLEYITQLDVNMSAELEKQAHTVHADTYAAAGDIEGAEWHIVSRHMFQSYMNAVLSITNVLEAELSGRSDDKYLAALVRKTRGLSQLISDLIGASDKSMGAYLETLGSAAAIYKQNAEAQNPGKKIVNACNALQWLGEVFAYGDERRFDPVAEAKNKFASLFAVYWLTMHGISRTDDVVEYKAAELTDNQVFKSMLSSMDIVTMLYPSNKLMAKAYEMYESQTLKTGGK